MMSSPPGSATLEVAREHVAGAHAVYLRLRVSGRHQRAAWLPGDSIASDLPTWIDDAVSRPGATLELTRTESAGIPVGQARELLTDQHRGLLALIGDPGAMDAWIAPNDIITGNRSHRRALERLFETHGIAADGVIVHPTRQWLLINDTAPRWHALYRQKTRPGLRMVDRSGMERLRNGLADWLYTQAAPNGLLPYKYWPGNGRYSPADNSLRRLLGVVALRQHAWSHGYAAQRAVADRCLVQLLDERYLAADGCGLISDRSGVKLGAVAIAGLALLAAPSSPDPDLLPALYRTTRRLWRDSGRFRTFWWPTARDDNHNFYPGEALLFWAQLHRLQGGASLRHAIDHSLAYYQRWHREQRNPAFVPWHTLTLACMFDLTGNRGYLDDLLAMNDWLLAVQQWDDAPFPDMRGRFYLPTRPDFGPPHASSTAVYCEGLVSAAMAARQAGHTAAARRFARAAQRGFVHLRQLQYLDTFDLFRFTHPARVAGALRTEVYDLTVRIDSVAHALQACLAWDAAGLDHLSDAKPLPA